MGPKGPYHCRLEGVWQCQTPQDVPRYEAPSFEAWTCIDLVTPDYFNEGAMDLVTYADHIRASIRAATLMINFTGSAIMRKLTTDTRSDPVFLLMLTTLT